MFSNTFIIACVATAATASRLSHGKGAHLAQEVVVSQPDEPDHFSSSYAQKGRGTQPDQINSESYAPKGVGGHLAQIKTHEGEITHADSGSEEVYNPNGMSLAQTFL